MHFRGEGKTLLADLDVFSEFYPMHFRGEGKTVTLARQSESAFYPMHFRGEGKTLSWRASEAQTFYPMHFRGEGKTLPSQQRIRFLFYPMHFRGEGKTAISDTNRRRQFYPMHFRGEGKTKHAAGWLRGSVQVYRQVFPRLTAAQPTRRMFDFTPAQIRRQSASRIAVASCFLFSAMLTSRPDNGAWMIKRKRASGFPNAIR